MVDGSNIVISGGTRGIGKEIAVLLAQKGANIAFTYISNDSQALELSEYICSLGRKCYFEKFDISDYQCCKAFSNHVKDKLGTVDVLINNAGVTADKSFVLMSEEDWKKVIDINLTGTYNLTRTMIFDFMKQKRGSIINISSVTGIIGAKQQANYAASKAGMIGMTKALAKELASYNIKVNAVAPGYINTDMTEKISIQLKDEFIKSIPLNRFGEAKEVAEFVYFLVNGGDSYITGHVFPIDGGISI